MTDMDRWRRMILLERIRDFHDVPFVISGNDYRNYGSPDRCSSELIKQAIGSYEGGYLNLCERYIMAAEVAQIAGIRALA